MTSELLPLMLRVALFSSLAILALLALRRPLRRWLGATIAYQAWMLVPIVTIAALLPGRPAPRLLAIHELRPLQAMVRQATTPAASSEIDALLLAWACGAILMTFRLILGHRAFLRKAGKLARSGELYISASDIGPAAVGLFHPRIVVPHDFAQRYSPSEQVLVIAHEKVHIARGDASANLIAEILRCALWFNPLVHYGVRRFRQDQELACDAAVMQRHPRLRRVYAEALLKSHTGGFRPDAGLYSHWQHPHPTKERIMNLQHTLPGPVRRMSGRCLLAMLATTAFFATVAARAEQAGAAPRYAVALAIATSVDPGIPFQVRADGFTEAPDKSFPRVLTSAGEKFSVSKDEWRLDMMIHPAETPDKVWLAGKLFKGDILVSAPTLLTRVGEAAAIKVGDGNGAFDMAMTVTPQP